MSRIISYGSACCTLVKRWQGVPCDVGMVPPYKCGVVSWKVPNTFFQTYILYVKKKNAFMCLSKSSSFVSLYTRFVIIVKNTFFISAFLFLICFSVKNTFQNRPKQCILKNLKLKFSILCHYILDCNYRKNIFFKFEKSYIHCVAHILDL